MNRIPPPIPARTWRQHLQWAEDYFLFPAGGGGGGRGAESSSSSLLSPSRLAVSPAVAFRFAGTGRTLVVRNKSGATYTGPSLRALLIRITDSGALDDHSDDDEEEEEHWDGEKQSHGGYDGYRRRRRGLQRRMLPAELDMGTCILRFWEGKFAERGQVRSEEGGV